MANRFPLTLNGTTIKELASGDNLDLTGNGIVGAGTVALTNLTVGGAQGSDGQVLTSTGSGVQWENASAGGLSNIVSDTSPQLGGNLDVNGQDIVTTSNGAIDLDPNGSGVVTFKGNATRGAGQFKLNCENNSHGITIKGPPHSAAASYTLTLPNTDGNADQVLKTNGSGVLDWVDSGGGGGAWNVISSQTVSNGTSSVSFTSGITGYNSYVLMMYNIVPTATYAKLYAKFAYNNNSSVATAGYTYTRLSANLAGPSTTYDKDANQSNGIKIANNIDTSLPAFGKLWFNTGSSVVGSEFTYLHHWSYPFTDHTSGYNQNSSFITTSINQIQLYFNTGDFASGTFTLYGLSTS